MDNNEQKILQKNLIKFLCNDVFNVIEPDELLKQVTREKWIHKGRGLEPQEIALLREEAKLFANSKFWKVLKAELEYHALKRMLEKSQNSEDIIASKLMLYLIDCINEKIKKMVS